MSNPLEKYSIDQLRTRSTIKWNAYPDDVLPLWIAEMDTDLAPGIVDRLTRSLVEGDSGYFYGQDFEKALQKFAEKHWNWHFDLEQTTTTPDVMNGVSHALTALVGRGGTVVVSPPIYSPFYLFGSKDERTVVEAPLGEDGRLNFENLERVFAQLKKDGARAAYLLSNPHNPTGVVHTREELTQLAELARRYDVRVVADEIHAPLVYSDATFVPFLSVPGSENGVALTAASKAWNIAGMKAAVLIAGADSKDVLEAIPHEVVRGPSHIGYLAHTAAFETGEEWLEELLAGLEANRKLLGELIKQHLPNAKFRAPQGTYLAWIDLEEYGLNHHADPATGLAGPSCFFFDKARVAVSSGHEFGTGGEHAVRLNFACSQAVLTEAIERMAKALKEAGH